MTTVMHTRRFQSGVMLLEALIGILIFSIGILALVGMQTIATKSVTDSRSRAEAGKLANQLIGDMWLNRANLANYAYAGAGTAPSVLNNWITQASAVLPNVAANPPIITIGASALAGVTGNEVAITVRWQPPGESVHQYMTTAYIN